MSTEIAAQGRGAERWGLSMTPETREQVSKWVYRLVPVPCLMTFLYFKKSGASLGHSIWISGAVLMAAMAVGLLVLPEEKPKMRAISWGAWLFAAVCFAILGWFYP
jgi:hypothetical protein